jgi:plastocyanin
VRRVLLAAVLATGLPLIGACGGGGSKTPAATNGPTVILKNLSFQPDTLQVKVGDTVTWKWGESVAHNVTFPSFHSKTMTSGTYTHTFTAAGTFDYKCTIHPTMNGKLVVAA